MSKIYLCKSNYGSLYYVLDSVKWMLRLNNGGWVISSKEESFFKDNQSLTLIGNNFKLKGVA